MGKMIKPLVVVLLVLSIGSLILGSMLFGKRELLKGRAQKLEAGVAAIAKSVRMESFSQQALVVNDKLNLSAMDKPLKDVALAGNLLYEDLQTTKTDLEKTTQELDSTKTVLAQTEADLESANQEISRLEGSLQRANSELSELRPMISQLESEKGALQSTIDGLNEQITRSEEQIQDMLDKVNALEKTVADLETELGADAGKIVPKGLAGRIIAVNPYWNFVVLDIGKKSGLIADTEMLVHRDDRLIGKVHVSAVRDDMAIAEIANDWEQSPIREGDNVLF
ncbi:MAG: hypothetical protein PHP44_12540 [Kiritimatiellae bacterium]|nr:hypothetical protein [Kiritimatiellia bacterium]